MVTPQRPEALEVRPRHIPQALKDVAGWVMWRWWWNGKRWTKPPFSIDGVKIDQTDPKNWVDYSTALQTYQKGGFDGIGFSLGAKDSLGGVDLDGCVHGGVIENWALEIIDELGGYVEISPSGTGVRVFGLTSRRVEGRKKPDIEMYVDGRYLTVTGHKLDKSASDLVDFGEAFGRVYDRIFPDSPKDSDSTTEEPRIEGDVGEDLAERFLSFCEDDPTFKDRFYSRASVGDRSDHEFHLCAKLWEGGFTFDEIWALMDSSPQEKWRERGDDYKEATIRNAINAARSSEKDRGRGERSAGAVRVEGGGYVADLPGGEMLRVSCKKENWFVEVSGGTFKPAQISDKPIWFDNRKWEKLPEKMGIDPDLWDQIRGDVRRLEERRQKKEKARAEKEGAAGAVRVEDLNYYGFSLHDFGDDDEVGKFEFSRSSAAGTIPAKTPLAMDSSGKDIFYFDGQIYRPQGGPLISSILYTVCDDGVRKIEVGEVLDRIRANLQLYPVTWNPDPCLMPLQNGVLDLRGGEFRGYQAEDRFTFQYNAKWNPEGGDWRRFIWFLCTALPDPRDVLTAIDIMNAVALRIPFDIIVQLLGGGSNGKGVFEKVLLALFTAERSTALDLEELKKSRFGAGALFDVDLWIISEVEGVKDAISALKKIATGEFTDSDTKYGGRKKGRPHAVPILDSNNAFDFGDESYGRRRRMARLDFCYTFGDGPEMRPIDRQMEESLTTPDSLAGLVQIIAARAPGLLRDRKIYNRKTTEEAAEEYRRQQFSLSYFCDECLSAKGGEKVETTTIYGAYLAYCKLFKVPTPATKIALGKYISKVFGVQSVGTSEGSGESRRDYRYYPGVHITKPPQEAHSDHILKHSSDSTDRYPTDIRQKGGYEISICNYIPTDTTDKTLIRVLEEICRIFGFISSCEDERDITWENYLRKSVGSVVSVGTGRCITVFYPTDENPTAKPVGGSVVERPGEVVAGEGEDYQTIAEELEVDRRRQAEEAARTATPEPKAKRSRRLERLYEVPRYDKKYGILYQPDGKALEYSPWAVNVAKSCSHGCKYCYGPAVARKTKDQYRDVPDPKTDLIKRINAGLGLALKDGCDIPRVHLTFAGDLYDPESWNCDEFSSHEEQTRAVIEAIHSRGVGVQILTKGKAAARDFDLLGPRDRFGCTLTFIDPEKSKEWEPNAALPSERIENLRVAKEKGLTTWASLEPIIDFEETKELIRRSAEYVDIFAVGKWNHDKRADGIDWRKGTTEVAALLDSLGCDYYIKDDLRRHLPAERSAPKKDGVFDLPISDYVELSIQTNGLTTKVLKQALGWDDLRAGIALNGLSRHGWQNDEAGRLHPPATGEVVG